MTPSPPALVPARIRGLVFDLDGTLVDSYGAITEGVNRARAAFGLDPVGESEIRGAVGHGAEALLARYVGAENAAEGVRLFTLRYSEVIDAGTSPTAGAIETLRILRGRGFRLAVASNKPARFTERILTRLEVADLFGAILGPDVTGVAKPDPAMIRACLRALAVDPDEAAYVGDMVLDVESAARAGVAAILVRGGSSPEADLRATGEIVLRSIAELPALLPGSWLRA